jgi:hypothetical protein
MTTLADFLLARIAEDEGAAWHVHDLFCSDLHWYQRYGKPTHGVECDGCVQPGRKLAECEAKRAMLEIHHDGNAGLYPHSGGFCSCCTDSEGLSDPGWPCPTLRTLVAPYADHPDYREEWRA